MNRKTNDRNKQKAHTENSSSFLPYNIAVDKLYLVNLSQVNQKGILITTGCKTEENKITLKLEHPDDVGLLQLGYKGPKFSNYFPPNATVKVSEILLKKLNTEKNKFCLKNIQEDLTHGDWNIKHIVTKNESDCHYLFKKAIKDKYTVILAILLEIIDANNSSQNIALHLHDVIGLLLHRAINETNMEMIKVLFNFKLDINAKNKLGSTPLHVAINVEMPDVVDFLINNSADVNVQNNKLQSPLHLAAKNNNHQILYSLLKNLAKLDEKDSNGQTPLHYAVITGNVSVVDYLLRRRANYRLEDKSNRTPFHLAAQQKSLDMIECFLDNNIEADIVNSFGQTPLCYLTRNPIDPQPQGVDEGTYLKIINSLLKKGANINFQDRVGNTPLHYAMIDDNIKCMQALLKCNADETIKNKFGLNVPYLTCLHKANKCLQVFLDHNIDVYIGDKVGRNALHIAVERENYEAVELILKKNININKQDHFGRTPLYIAVQRDCLPIIQLLLKNGANVNPEDTSEKIPLHLAIQHNNLPIVTLLLENGADVNLKSEDVSIALHVASLTSNVSIDIIESIVNSTNNINAKDYSGQTALHYAAMSHNVDLLKCLVEKNPDVNVQDNFGRTPLLSMIYSDMTNKSCIECIKVLVDHKADVNAADEEEMTPLHWTCRYKNFEVFKYLIEIGADSSIRDKHGNTVFHYVFMFDSDFSDLPHDKKTKILKDFLDILVEEDISVNDVDKSGQTPLHKLGNAFMTEVLLKIGADINIEDGDHNTVFDIFIKHRKPTDWVGSLPLLYKHVIKMKVMKLWVLQKTLDKVYEVKKRGYLEPIQDYKRDCNKEISIMKTTNIDQCNITYYDFFKKSLHNAIYYARNQNVVNAIKSEELIDLFPIYGHFLKSHLYEAQRRSRLYNQIQVLAELNIFEMLPTDCVHEIFRYLNASDLKMLLEAL